MLIKLLKNTQLYLTMSQIIIHILNQQIYMIPVRHKAPPLQNKKKMLEMKYKSILINTLSYSILKIDV